MLQIEAVDTPIRFNPEGVAYIGSTRVLLGSVIWAFLQGETPEQIIDSYDTLSLADVYAVIAYYLRHREAVDTHLELEQNQADQLRRDLEAQRPEMFRLQARLREIKKAQKPD
jgi:uncharacterized protein (DUF433 family)